MHFSSFFSLSLRFVIFYSCNPTAAATLPISPAKRGRPLDPIECPGPLFPQIPSDLPQYPSLLDMCASRAEHPMNMGCICVGNQLICASSSRRAIRMLIEYCFEGCNCGDDTVIVKDEYSQTIEYHSGTSGNPIIPISPWARIQGIQEGQSGTQSNGLVTGHTCSKTCTSVSQGCAWAFTGDCTCYAPPVGIFFWHRGDCGTAHHRPHLPKRELAQQRHNYYVNATAQYAPLNNATALPAPSPDLSAQIASGMLPSPCNASYVSFACSDSPDGIVHEPLENWLGALLPENAKILPPVPEGFLKIHKIVEVASQTTAE